MNKLTSKTICFHCGELQELIITQGRKSSPAPNPTLMSMSLYSRRNIPRLTTFLPCLLPTITASLSLAHLTSSLTAFLLLL